MQSVCQYSLWVKGKFLFILTSTFYTNCRYYTTPVPTAKAFSLHHQTVTILAASSIRDSHFMGRCSLRSFAALRMTLNQYKVVILRFAFRVLRFAFCVLRFTFYVLRFADFCG
jgi:hypothetical protein